MEMERKHYDNPQGLLKERKKLVVDTICRNNPSRVPLLSNAWSWKICDAGYKLRDAMTDYDKLYHAACRHHEIYECDIYMDLCTRNPVRYSDVFGKGPYIFDDEKNILSIQDTVLMDESEYPELIEKGLQRFYFEKVVPRRYGITSKEAYYGKWKDAAKEYVQLGNFVQRVNSTFEKEYGVPEFCPFEPMLPVEVLYNVLRGMKGSSMDQRRHKKEMSRAVEVIDEYYFPMFQKVLANYQDKDSVYFPIRCTTLAHNMMNIKQFEELTWPYIKRFSDIVVQYHMQSCLFTEGSIKHLLPYFQQLPAGYFTLIIEQDDPVEMKKALPNMTIAGGYPSTLLATATPQECIDAAKRLIDEMAYDRNYIFSCDKMLSYPTDCKAENLKAVCDFVREYGVYK